MIEDNWLFCVTLARDSGGGCKKVSGAEQANAIVSALHCVVNVVQHKDFLAVCCDTSIGAGASMLYSYVVKMFPCLHRGTACNLQSQLQLVLTKCGLYLLPCGIQILHTPHSQRLCLHVMFARKGGECGGVG